MKISYPIQTMILLSTKEIRGSNRPPLFLLLLMFGLLLSKSSHFAVEVFSSFFNYFVGNLSSLLSIIRSVNSFCSFHKYLQFSWLVDCLAPLGLSLSDQFLVYPCLLQDPMSWYAMCHEHLSPRDARLILLHGCY